MLQKKIATFERLNWSNEQNGLIMDQNLAVVFMFIAALTILAVIIKALLSYRIKQHLIKAGLLDEESVKLLSKVQINTGIDTLKWGLLLLFGGLGLILLHFIPFQTGSTLPYGIETVFLSVGFLIYYFLSAKKLKD